MASVWSESFFFRVAEWKPGSCDRIPLKEILPYGPGLDCLRYAEWTPENTKQPMFTQTVHSKLPRSTETVFTHSLYLELLWSVPKLNAQFTFIAQYPFNGHVWSDI